MTEKELIRGCQIGDENAFSELIRRYQPRVAATVVSMIGAGDQAEDVAQETFIRFFKGVGRFRGDASVATYITRIAINLCLNEISRQKKRQSIFHEELTEKMELDANMSQPQPSPIEKDLIQQAIEKLEPHYRSVVVLRLMEEFSTEETADILDLPLGTVLSRLYRAQQKLRSFLTPILD